MPLPVPPNLAKAFGYRGEARFVAFRWEPAGDEVVYDDGRLWGTGDPWAFLAYRRHAKVAPHLEPYNLGHSDIEAEHCLILDRKESRAFIAAIAVGRAFLRSQHLPPSELTPYEIEEVRMELKERFGALQEGGWREVQIDQGIIRNTMEEQRRAVAQMLDFLDQSQPPADDGL